MTREDKSLLLKVGLFAAGYFIVLKPILEALGLKDDEKDKLVNNAFDSSNKNNPFSPIFWQGKPGARLLTVANATKMAKDIRDSFTLLGDNEDRVYSIFRSLKAKTQVSFLAMKFQEMYSMDLLGFLKSGGQILPYSGLNNSELAKVISIVNQLDEK